MRNRVSTVVLLSCALAFCANAQTQDGSIGSGEYGANVYQNTQTGFGDNLSEADGLFIGNDLNNLYAAVSGNIEGNSGNRMVIVLDTKAGGVSTMPASMGLLSGQDHLTFGGGFLADYVIHMNIFNGIAYVDLYDIGASNNIYLGGSIVGSAGWDPGQGGAQIGNVSMNNSNTAGVSGGNGLDANAATATTGFEISLPLAQLGISGNPRGQTVCLMAYITSGNGYFSNQFLPGMGGGDNVGFNSRQQNEFLCYNLVPEPASMTALALGLGALVLRRRRHT